MSEEVFETGNGSPANFTDGRVKVTVNGQAKGYTTVQPGETVGQLLTRQAQAYGVRRFSAFADGHKLTTNDASRAASGIQQVEIIAKDARGCR